MAHTQRAVAETHMAITGCFCEYDWVNKMVEMVESLRINLGRGPRGRRSRRPRKIARFIPRDKHPLTRIDAGEMECGGVGNRMVLRTLPGGQWQKFKQTDRLCIRIVLV